SKKCVLIGYSTNKKAYKLLSLDSKNVFYSRDVKFYENIFPFKQKTCDSTDVDNISEVDHLHFFDGQFPQSPDDDGKDSSVEDAMSDDNWFEAMNNEIEVLNRNNTWTICDLLVGRKPIGNANNAFLYGDRLEDVYMILPDGYNNEDTLKFSKFDYSLYTKYNDDKFIALLVYVDDIVITGNVDTGIKKFKLFFSAKFLIKDLGVLKYFLGIKIIENDLGPYTSQRGKDMFQRKERRIKFTSLREDVK
nr:hypothetical protein [Tanacetum cinerariifolium]